MAHADVRIHGQRMLGTYSTVSKRNEEEDREEMEYVNDDRNRRFYLQGDDIMFDYEDAYKIYTPPRFQEGLYKWMRDHRQVLIDNEILDTDRSRLNVDFVACRGLLTDILQVGGNKEKEVSVAVTLYRGTYHIRKGKSEFAGDSRSREREGDNSDVIAASSKLLLRFLTSRDGRTPDEPAPVNDNEAFFGVMSVNCGIHRLVIRGGLHAEERVNTDDPPPALPNPRKCLNVRSRNQDKTVSPEKALEWWAPNVISGIPKIVVGLRDDRPKQRIIQRVVYEETDKLAKSYAKDRWEPEACIRTMESLLSQIKELVPEDDPESFKNAFLVIRRVPEGPGVQYLLRNRRFEVRNRQKGENAVEEQEILDVLEKARSQGGASAEK